MRSSAKAVRLPGPRPPSPGTRPVSRFGFLEEAPEAAPPDEPSAAPEPTVEARIAAARAEGHGAGLIEGIARGREEGEARARGAADLLGKAVERLAALKAGVQDGAEKEILDLAVAVAARIVRREVSVDADFIVRVLSDALRRVSPLEEVVAKVNPADLAHIKAVPGLEARLSEIRHFVLVEDRRVNPGGCLIETAAGSIDARIETQLEEIERALARARPSADGPGNEG